MPSETRPPTRTTGAEGFEQTPRRARRDGFQPAGRQGRREGPPAKTGPSRDAARHSAATRLGRPMPKTMANHKQPKKKVDPGKASVD